MFSTALTDDVATDAGDPARPGDSGIDGIGGTGGIGGIGGIGGRIRVVMPARIDRPRHRGKLLGERLTEAGLLTPAELDNALAHQRSSRVNKPLGEVITELGLVDEANLIPLLGEQLGVPGVRLREGLIDPAAIALLPRLEAERWQVLPLMRVRDELTVAMADPKDLTTIDALHRATGLRIRPVFTLASGIERLLPRCYEDDFSVDSVTADLDVEDLEMESEAIDLDGPGTMAQAEGSPVINLINYAIIQAVRQGASDIHIEPGMKTTSVRFRIDGSLREVMRPKRELHAALVSRVKVMAKLDIAEHRQPQDGRLHVRINHRDVDLRISTLPTVLGEKVVMRVLDRGNITFDLQKLGLPPRGFATISHMLAQPHGLVLVTGPTGSGKTTTLYSAVELIKGIERNVVTVEDPVEYQLELINQVQVNTESGMSFAGALRSILRQDPDVIMVGEIRDRETAETAIQAALTGHLVLSTLHTNDSAAAITRLIDMGVERFKIAAAVVGVVAQRLVRNICEGCAQPTYPTAAMLDPLGYQSTGNERFRKGRGCSQCFESGFRGRSGIYETMTVHAALREAIIGGASLEQLRQIGVGDSLMSEGLRLAAEGVTSLDEVARVAPMD